MSRQTLDLDYFEKVVVYKSLTDDRYLASVIDHVQPRFFTDESFKRVFTLITSFFQKRFTVPTKTEILSFCNTPELKEDFKNTVKKIKDIDKNLNVDELYQNTERFLKEKSVYHTMTDVADDCSKGDINPASIFDKFEKCCSINLSVDTGFDFLRSYSRLIEDLKTEEPTISSGWQWLDNKLDGGFLENGRSIYIFAGETNVGKSIVLGNIACNIAKQGKTVLLVSLEMSEMVYAKRLAGNLTGIEVNNLRYELPQLEDKLQSFITNNPTSRLLIKEFPPSTITPSQLGAFIKKIQQNGVELDAIVLDYVNLMHSPMGNNSYERVKIATEQVRALSYQYNCPVITATQLNRSGYDKEDPSLDTIGESMGLAMGADAIFSVFQKEEDRDLDIIRMGVMKNRFGPNHGTSEFSIHYPTLTISDGDIHDIGSTSADVISVMDGLGK
jgi:replicative DNA helicase